MSGLGNELKIRVVHPAKAPERPFSPNVKVMFACGLAAGLIVGVGLALIVASRDQPWRSVASAAGSAPGPADKAERDPPVRPRPRTHRPAPDVEDPMSDRSESFLTLRAAMETLSSREACRTILFASALSGEGKTSCAVHYAKGLAQQGHKTVLIDLDSDTLEADRLLDITLAGRQGVAHVLNGTNRLAEVIQDVKGEGLSYIAAGAPSASLLEPLIQGGFGPLLQEILQQFDRVVVSSPPLLELNGARAILGQVDNICLVIRYAQDQAPAGSADHAALAQSGCATALAGV